MAASIFIEQESGTSRGWVHPHNGYYAGDFTGPRNTRRPQTRFNGAWEPHRTGGPASSPMGRA
jgi:hypothetical protein